MCAMSTLDNISYRPMTRSDYGWLYDLLQQRMTRLGVNISHRRMPSYEDHVAFWDAQPYACAWIIMSGYRPVGYFYLTKILNELGIQCFAEFDTQAFYLVVIDHVLKMGLGEILANVNPRHSELITALRARGFEVCQHTYRRTE